MADSPTYSRAEIANIMRQAGWPEELIPTFSAVALGESSGNPYAVNPRGNDDSHGLFQINLKGSLRNRIQQFGLSGVNDLYDPLTNAKVALEIYKQQGPTAWGAYTNGSYKKYLNENEDLNVGGYSAPNVTGKPGTPFNLQPVSPNPQPQQQPFAPPPPRAPIAAGQRITRQDLTQVPGTMAPRAEIPKEAYSFPVYNPTPPVVDYRGMSSGQAVPGQGGALTGQPDATGLQPPVTDTQLDGQIADGQTSEIAAGQTAGLPAVPPRTAPRSRYKQEFTDKRGNKYVLDPNQKSLSGGQARYSMVEGPDMRGADAGAVDSNAWILKGKNFILERSLKAPVLGQQFDKGETDRKLANFKPFYVTQDGAQFVKPNIFPEQSVSQMAAVKAWADKIPWFKKLVDKRGIDLKVSWNEQAALALTLNGVPTTPEEVLRQKGSIFNWDQGNSAYMTFDKNNVKKFIEASAQSKSASKKQLIQRVVGDLSNGNSLTPQMRQDLVNAGYTAQDIENDPRISSALTAGENARQFNNNVSSYTNILTRRDVEEYARTGKTHPMYGDIQPAAVWNLPENQRKAALDLIASKQAAASLGGDGTYSQKEKDGLYRMFASGNEAYEKARKQLIEEGRQGTDEQIQERLKEDVQFARDIETYQGYGRADVKSWFWGNSLVVGFGRAGKSSWDAINGLLRPIMPTDAFRKWTRSLELAKARVEANAASPEHWWGSGVVMKGAELSGDLARYYLLSKIPGLGKVPMGLDAGLQAAGRGEDTSSIARNAAFGATIDGIFYGAHAIGGKVFQSLLLNVGARMGAGTVKSFVTNQAMGNSVKLAMENRPAWEKLFKYTEWMRALKANEQGKKYIIKLEAPAATRKEVITRLNEVFSNSNLREAFTSETATPAMRNWALAAAIAKETTIIGTVFGGTYAATKVSGDKDNAFNNALHNAALDFLFRHSPTAINKLSDIVGKIWQFTIGKRKGQVTVDPDGNVHKVDKPVPESAVDGFVNVDPRASNAGPKDSSINVESTPEGKMPEDGSSSAVSKVPPDGTKVYRNGGDHVGTVITLPNGKTHVAWTAKGTDGLEKSSPFDDSWTVLGENEQPPQSGSQSSADMQTSADASVKPPPADSAQADGEQASVQSSTKTRISWDQMRGNGGEGGLGEHIVETGGNLPEGYGLLRPTILNLSTANEFDGYYSRTFDMDNPKGGNIYVEKPALVRRNAEGKWELVEKGKLSSDPVQEVSPTINDAGDNIVPSNQASTFKPGDRVTHPETGESGTVREKRNGGLWVEPDPIDFEKDGTPIRNQKNRPIDGWVAEQQSSAPPSEANPNTNSSSTSVVPPDGTTVYRNGAVGKISTPPNGKPHVLFEVNGEDGLIEPYSDKWSTTPPEQSQGETGDSKAPIQLPPSSEGSEQASSENSSLLVQGGDTSESGASIENVPDAEPAKKGDAKKYKGGVKLVDTRGKGEFFHGAAAPIEDFNDGNYNDFNIYGQGLYSTDDLITGVGYQGKNRKQAIKDGQTPQGVTYKLTEKEPVKLLNLDEPFDLLPAEVQETLTKELESSASFSGAAADGLALVQEHPNATLGQVYDEIRDASAGHGESTDTIQEVFDGIREALTDAGYGGFEHVGGKLAGRGKKLHTVRIYWDPKNQLEKEAVNLDDYADKGETSTPAKPEASADLDAEIEAARAGDTKAQARLKEYGIPWEKQLPKRFVKQGEVDALLKGEKITGRFEGTGVDVTSSDTVTTAASAEFKVTFKDESQFDDKKTGSRVQYKGETGDGHVKGGYDLSDVQKIERLDKNGNVIETVYDKDASVSGPKFSSSLKINTPDGKKPAPKLKIAKDELPTVTKVPSQIFFDDKGERFDNSRELARNILGAMKLGVKEYNTLIDDYNEALASGDKEGALRIKGFAEEVANGLHWRRQLLTDLVNADKLTAGEVSSQDRGEWVPSMNFVGKEGGNTKPAPKAEEPAASEGTTKKEPVEMVFPKEGKKPKVGDTVYKLDPMAPNGYWEGKVTKVGGRLKVVYEHPTLGLRRTTADLEPWSTVKPVRKGKVETLPDEPKKETPVATPTPTPPSGGGPESGELEPEEPNKPEPKTDPTKLADNEVVHWTSPERLSSILENDVLEGGSVATSLDLPFDVDNKLPFGIILDKGVLEEYGFKNLAPDTLGATKGELEHEMRGEQDVPMTESQIAFVTRNKKNADKLRKLLEEYGLEDAEIRIAGKPKLKTLEEPNKPEPTSEPKEEGTVDKIKAFNEIANQQRGEPEEAMRELQRLHSGVYSYVAEHVGDLINRITSSGGVTPSPGSKDDFHGKDRGWGYAADKVEKALNTLNRGDKPDWVSFEDEHQSNIANNAASKKLSLNAYKQQLAELGDAYATAHGQLPVYNRAQELARDAAIAIGKQHFDKARAALTELSGMLNKGKTESEHVDNWAQEANKFDINYKTTSPIDEKTVDGKLKEKIAAKKADIEAMKDRLPSAANDASRKKLQQRINKAEKELAELEGREYVEPTPSQPAPRPEPISSQPVPTPGGGGDVIEKTPAQIEADKLDPNLRADIRHRIDIYERGKKEGLSEDEIAELGGMSPKNISELYGIDRAVVDAIPKKGDLGTFGQMSYKLRGWMADGNQRLLEDLADALEPRADLSNRELASHVVMDALAGLAGKRRSSLLNRGDYDNIIEALIHKVPEESILRIIEAQTWQSKYSRAIRKMTDKPEFRAVIDKARRMGWDNVKQFDKADKVTLRRIANEVGDEYGNREGKDGETRPLFTNNALNRAINDALAGRHRPFFEDADVKEVVSNALRPRGQKQKGLSRVPDSAYLEAVKTEGPEKNASVSEDGTMRMDRDSSYALTASTKAKKLRDAERAKEYNNYAESIDTAVKAANEDLSTLVQRATWDVDDNVFIVNAEGAAIMNLIQRGEWSGAMGSHYIALDTSNAFGAVPIDITYRLARELHDEGKFDEAEKLFTLARDLHDSFLSEGWQDMTWAYHNPEFPVASQNVLIEEKGHREDKRYTFAARTPAGRQFPDIKVDMDRFRKMPAYQRAAEAMRQKGYTGDSVYREVIGQSFRNDASEHMGISEADIKKIQTEYALQMVNNGMQPDMVQSNWSKVGPRGKSLADSYIEIYEKNKQSKTPGAPGRTAVDGSGGQGQGVSDAARAPREGLERYAKDAGLIDGEADLERRRSVEVVQGKEQVVYSTPKLKGRGVERVVKSDGEYLRSAHHREIKLTDEELAAIDSQEGLLGKTLMEDAIYLGNLESDVKVHKVGGKEFRIDPNAVVDYARKYSEPTLVNKASSGIVKYGGKGLKLLNVPFSLKRGLQATLDVSVGRQNLKILTGHKRRGWQLTDKGKAIVAKNKQLRTLFGNAQTELNRLEEALKDPYLTPTAKRLLQAQMNTLQADLKNIESQFVTVDKKDKTLAKKKYTDLVGKHVHATYGAAFSKRVANDLKQRMWDDPYYEYIKALGFEFLNAVKPEVGDRVTDGWSIGTVIDKKVGQRVKDPKTGKMTWIYSDKAVQMSNGKERPLTQEWEPAHSAASVEELFASNLFGKAPLWDSPYMKRTFSESRQGGVADTADFVAGRTRQQALRPMQASERSFSVAAAWVKFAAMKARIQEHEALAAFAGEEVNEDALRYEADFLNALQGVKTFSSERVNKIVGALTRWNIIYSARNSASQLTLLWPGYYMKAPRVAQGYMVKTLLRSQIAMYAASMLAAALGATVLAPVVDKGMKKFIESVTQAGFLRERFGPFSANFGADLLQWLTPIIKTGVVIVTSAMEEDDTTPQYSKVKGVKMPKKSTKHDNALTAIGKIWANFLPKKGGTFGSNVIAGMRGKDALGTPTSYTEEFFKNWSPISLGQFAENVQLDPLQGTMATLLDLNGVGVTTLEPPESIMKKRLADWEKYHDLKRDKAWKDKYDYAVREQVKRIAQEAAQQAGTDYYRFPTLKERLRAWAEDPNEGGWFSSAEKEPPQEEEK